MEIIPQKHDDHPIFAGNPMLIEIVRYRRKYLSFSGPNALNRVVLGLIACCYTGLVLIVFSMKGDMPPVPLMLLQTAAFVLFAPMMLNNSIAGERERRSWDLLAAAPITHAQIVVGKFLGALSALGVAAIAFLVPMLLAWALHGRTPALAILEAEAISLSFGAFCCALTIFFSARVKRGFMALGASLGLLVLALVIVPMMIAGAGGSGSSALDLFLNPFWALGDLSSAGEAYRSMSPEGLNVGFYGVIDIVVYLGLTVTLLVWAEKTVHFPENEVKFIPRSSDHA